jgi:hypothetical protein
MLGHLKENDKLSKKKEPILRLKTHGIFDVVFLILKKYRIFGKR